ncbi:hypothetical protein K402DRAFT_120198 [Aulographum hederae CBS 113979]|uniref:Pheromone-regulated membrane protein n=1 Tax=Aulographum hederae CBS 113979 TaxID=1176131 RepID=A0A6G1GV94_9PEZI|nr:hypothetical protein K402DRAFT_120198 [Aulographum hederae CBS 113979]
MGCCGEREKGIVSEEAKWDYLVSSQLSIRTLSDFRSSNCLTRFSYCYVWFLVFVSIAVYGADTFTAVSLLAFDRWSSQLKPPIPFQVTKWIFAGCIIVSFIILAFEMIRAVRVIKRGGIAESYLDRLAAVWYSIGFKGKGWRRFLVFAELTKSRKGVDYVALFVYFQFQTAIRTLVAEAPRQVLNGLTLWTVLKSDIVPEGEHAAPKGKSPVAQFFSNIGALADADYKQAVILSSMLFTFVIWVLSAILLLVAVILYVFFLWHHVPEEDGRLSRYCRRKVDSRLARIVQAITRKAMEKDEAKRRKAEARDIKNGIKPKMASRMPTLPSLVDDSSSDKDYKFEHSRHNSVSTLDTLPSYQPNGPRRTDSNLSQSTMARQPTLPDLDDAKPRPAPSRSVTQSSYGSNAPLLTQAGEMGYSDPNRAESPVPPVPTYPGPNNGPRPGQMGRSMTGNSMNSMNSQRSFTPGSRPGTANGGPPGRGPSSRGPPGSRGTPNPGGYGPPSRSNTGFSSLGPNRNTPGPSPVSPISPFDQRNGPDPAYAGEYEMSPVAVSPEDYFSRQPLPQPPQMRAAQTPRPQSPYGAQPQPRSQSPYDRRQGPSAPPQQQRTASPGSGPGGYVAFNPNAHGQPASTPTPPPMQMGMGGRGPSAPQRSMTAPMPPPQGQGQGQGQGQMGMRGPPGGPTQRSASARPQQQQQQQHGWNGGYAL